MRTIYLDYNATTPMAPAVQTAVLPFLAEQFGNPSSGHSLGRAAQEAVEDSRYWVAEALGSMNGEIVFTGGGTESINLAIKGAALAEMAQSRAARKHVMISSLEHAAVSETAHFLSAWGFEITEIPATAHGTIEPAAVAETLRPETLLVSVIHANHDVGTIQPIAEIAAICQPRGVLVHTDATQTVGKVPVSVGSLGVDLLSLSAHKFYGPKGAGALFVKQGTPLTPWLHGAGNERGLRAGTENVPFLVGLGHAVRLATRHVQESGVQLAVQRDRLWQLLRAEIGGQLTANGAQVPRLPNTLSVNFPGVSAMKMLQRLPELCAAAGASGFAGTPAVGKLAVGTLAAMGVPAEVARGTMRLSLGWYTTDEEIDRAVSLLVNAWESLVN